MPLVEVETADGRWARVPRDSVAAQLYSMKVGAAELQRKSDQVAASLSHLKIKIERTKPVITEIHSFGDLESASLAGVLTKGQAFRYIEKRSAELASKFGLSKPESIQKFCEQNPAAYRFYVEAKQDAPALNTASATPAPRVMGAAELKIDTKARAFAAAHNVTYAAAVNAVCAAEPGLYRQHVAESRAR